MRFNQKSTKVTAFINRLMPQESNYHREKEWRLAIRVDLRANQRSCSLLLSQLWVFLLGIYSLFNFDGGCLLSAREHRNCTTENRRVDMYFIWQLSLKKETCNCCNTQLSWSTVNYLTCSENKYLVTSRIMQEAWNWGKIPQRRAHIFFYCQRAKSKETNVNFVVWTWNKWKTSFNCADCGNYILLRPHDLSDRHSPSPSSAYSWKR